MSKCPLCGNKAVVVPPEWSGARILINCPNCGEYQTNKITIAELDELRRKNSQRIDELRYSIATADHLWHITKSQRLGLIILESGPPREMTKWDKKHRRRNVGVTFPMYKITNETPEGGSSDS